MFPTRKDPRTCDQVIAPGFASVVVLPAVVPVKERSVTVSNCVVVGAGRSVRMISMPSISGFSTSCVKLIVT